MKNRRKCYRCRLPAPKPEHLYQRGDGRWWCMPCIVLLMADAEVAQANKVIDDFIEISKRRHQSHVVVNLDCPFCALEVR